MLKKYFAFFLKKPHNFSSSESFLNLAFLVPKVSENLFSLYCHSRDP